MYSVYEAQIKQNGDSTDFEWQVAAGSTRVSIRFVWDMALQEEYDNFERRIRQRAAADPLLRNGEIVREYDWIDFYSSYDEDSTVEYPQSLRNTDEDLRKELLSQMHMEALILKDVRETYTESLFWHATLTDLATSETYTADIQKNTIVESIEGWRAVFRSDLDKIGRDDLTKCVLQLEV